MVPKPIRPTFQEMGSLDVQLATMLVELLKTEDTALAEIPACQMLSASQALPRTDVPLAG